VTNRYPSLATIADLPSRVLVFAPHPDDEVLGCGGALALHARRGDHVRVVVVSDGGAGGDPQVRAAEAQAAA
jgi:LmbE family N-acetylglucosaminyl deacetylase